MSFLIGSPSSFDPLIKASGDEGGQVEGASAFPTVESGF